MKNMFFEMVLAACMWFVILQVGVALLVLAIYCRKKKVRCILSAVFAGLLLSWSMAAFGALIVSVHMEEDFYISEMNRFFGHSEYEPDYSYGESSEEYEKSSDGREYIEDFTESTGSRDYNMFSWRGEWYSSVVNGFLNAPEGYDKEVVAYFRDTRFGEEVIKEVWKSSTESGYDVLILDGEVYYVLGRLSDLTEFYNNYPEDKWTFEIWSYDFYMIDWECADITFDKTTFDSLWYYSGYETETEISQENVDEGYYISRKSDDGMLCRRIWVYQIGNEIYIRNDTDEITGAYEEYISVYKLSDYLAGKVREAYKQFENIRGY